MKRYIFTLLIILFTYTGFSQDFYDALRFSQTNYGGTARSISMGSAFGAIGGDFISASINPAGMGIYRSDEFSFSPTLNMKSTDALYLGTTSPDSKTRFNFDNLSYVIHFAPSASSGISGITFGIGYNRLKNMHNSITIKGKNAESSLLNYYTNNANTIGNDENFHDLHEGLFWRNYLIDIDYDPNVVENYYINDWANYSEKELYDNNGNFAGLRNEVIGIKPHTQRSRIDQRGRIDEYVMSLGINANHKFYFGASVGLLDLEYHETTTYSETDENNLSEYLNRYTYQNSVSHSGMGVNFKTGIIYRPIKWLRLGAAIHTPDFYTTKLSQSKNLEVNYDLPIGNDEDGYKTYYSENAKAKTYSYKLETPLRAVLSGVVQLGSKGMVSADYEYINYPKNKIVHAGDNWDYSDQNTEIQNMFHASSNIRLGGEYRVTENLSVRGGLQFLGNPWNNSYIPENSTEAISLPKKDDSYTTYSAGIGYRQQGFFIDFAYRLSAVTEKHFVHEPSWNDYSSSLATLNSSYSQATITFGFRF
jgi:hypothetical protein